MMVDCLFKGKNSAGAVVSCFFLVNTIIDFFGNWILVGSLSFHHQRLRQAGLDGT